MKPEKKEGWQMIVEFYEDHVIKHPKNKEQMEKTILPYLQSIGKENELEERVSKMVEDTGRAIRILKASDIPRGYLANLTFLKDGAIRQDRVPTLDEVFQKSDDEGLKRIIDKYIEFITFLWGYGIHEKTYKMSSNFGLVGDEIVLVDPFEITDLRKKVLADIRKRKWAKDSRYGENLNKKMIAYLVGRANEAWTEERLKEVWGRDKRDNWVRRKKS